MKKLTLEQKKEIRAIRKLDGTSYRNLATIYGVTVNAIYTICNPESYKKQKKSRVAKRRHQKKWKHGRK